jgi:hypothetical protein
LPDRQQGFFWGSVLYLYGSTGVCWEFQARNLDWDTGRCLHRTRNGIDGVCLQEAVLDRGASGVVALRASFDPCINTVMRTRVDDNTRDEWVMDGIIWTEIGVTEDGRIEQYAGTWNRTRRIRGRSLQPMRLLISTIQPNQVSFALKRCH